MRIIHITCFRFFILAFCSLLSSTALAVWIPIPGYNDYNPDNSRYIFIEVRLVDTTSGKGVIDPQNSTAAWNFLVGSTIELRWKDSGVVFASELVDGRSQVFRRSSSGDLRLPEDATSGRVFEYTYTIPNYGVIEGESFVNFAIPDLRDPTGRRKIKELIIGVPVDATGWDNNVSSVTIDPVFAPAAWAMFNYNYVMEDPTSAGVLIPTICIPNLQDADTTVTLTFDNASGTPITAVYPYRAFHRKFPHAVWALWCGDHYRNDPVYPDYPLLDWSRPPLLRVDTAPPSSAVTFKLELENYQPSINTVQLLTQGTYYGMAIVVPTPSTRAATFDPFVKALAAPAKAASAEDWLLYQ